MLSTNWTIDTGHAFAPGSAPLLSLDGLGPIAALLQSGGGVVVVVLLTMMLASAMDHLFSPSLQRRFGPVSRD